MKTNNFKYTNTQEAFTLAETIITITILGVVAALTIPGIIRNHIMSTNRTKVKKAVGVYDHALNKMVLENNLISNYSLIEFGGSNCEKTSEYFKAVKNAVDASKNKNLCRFKAADGVWWDISDITHPIIALNEENLDNENSSLRFKMVGFFDNNGHLKINEMHPDAILSESDKEELTKLYNFMFSHSNQINLANENQPKPSEDDPSANQNPITPIVDDSCDTLCKIGKNLSKYNTKCTTGNNKGCSSVEGCANMNGAGGEKLGDISVRSCTVYDDDGNEIILISNNGKNITIKNLDTNGEKISEERFKYTSIGDISQRQQFVPLKKTDGTIEDKEVHNEEWRRNSDGSLNNKFESTNTFYPDGKRETTDKVTEYTNTGKKASIVITKYSEGEVAIIGKETRTYPTNEVPDREKNYRYTDSIERTLGNENGNEVYYHKKSSGNVGDDGIRVETKASYGKYVKNTENGNTYYKYYTCTNGEYTNCSSSYSCYELNMDKTKTCP